MFICERLSESVSICVSMSVSIRVSVSKGRVPVYLRARVAGSLSFPILACSLVQDPRSSASFPHTVAYNPDTVMSTYFTHDSFNGFFTRDFLSTW